MHDWLTELEGRPIHEKIAEYARRFEGTIAKEGWLERLEMHLQTQMEHLCEQDPIFGYACPIEIRVGTDPRRPGSFFWYFEVTDTEDILWGSIHKAHVDKHFPAKLFPRGRPEVPDYEKERRKRR